MLTDSWWDTVDPLSHVIGVLVLNHRELAAEMDRVAGRPTTGGWSVWRCCTSSGGRTKPMPEQVFRACRCTRGR